MHLPSLLKTLPVLLVAACNTQATIGTGGPHTNRPDSGTVVSDGGRVDPPMPTPDAGTEPLSQDAGTLELSPEPAGAAALSAFERLAYLKHGVHALSWSSEDPTGNNLDRNQYLSERAPGEQVIFDAQGPGVVYRFWSTRSLDNRTGDYRFYFDGEQQPRFTVSREQFWSGSLAPFLQPLTLPRSASSGGHITYYPFGFARSLMITSTGQRDPDYFNIQYARYSNGAKVETYTGREDLTAACGLWSRAGTALISPSATDVKVTLPIDVAAGGTGTLAEVTGAREITELRFTTNATDNGRAFTGGSTFRVAVNPANTGVKLVRRFDYGVANQRANVFVDGALVGPWEMPGLDSVLRWRNATFEIPESFTRNKSEITLTVQFVSSSNDWNEFHYWVYSYNGAAATLTDTVDVGNAASEQSHDYAVSEPTFAGSRTYQYPGVHRARLQLFWEGETTPAVDVPAAEFFGTLAERDARVRSLLVGNNLGDFYAFFPMPFEKSARIVLVNPAGGTPVQGTFSFTHRPFRDDFRKVGHFHAQYRSTPRTLLGKDYVVLDVEGTGHFVGMNLIAPGRNNALEGDERFYVDGSRSPALHGTGTEDYFNGGWYFEDGAFTTPTHGVPWLPPTDCGQAPCGPRFSAYRFHIADVVPFSASLRVSIEHGPVNDNTEPYASVAYFYLRPSKQLTKTDEVVIANDANETAHGYTAEGVRSTQQLAARFVGDNPEMRTFPSRAVTGSVSFRVAIDAQNDGVTLRRLFDQADPGQSAEVFVDGTSVGIWAWPTRNTTLRWREDDFWIPASATKGKQELQLKLVVKSPVWNESGYQVFVSNFSK